ncbi:MAG: FAD-binding oxidoreductase [Balneolaceae bacterium]|nr:FAD-binding oxidoreductase [Balneolaceae bacterium]MBO6546435.1 FAD-binding oxidoreductase [Balneolaceae bacterium]MBO6648794.1 FAD-binding oxidoreductase [Balneolaceae bacterium]
MSSYFDFCILGAGLAGISLAYELSKEDVSVCLVDPAGVAAGASGTPLGLVNPATGRFASKSWEAELCYAKILANLELIQDTSPVQFYKQTGVLRPAMDKKIASRMHENFRLQDWPEGWIEWKDEYKLTSFHPGINCVDGGVWLPIGLTVDITTYLKSFAHYLSMQSIHQVYDKSYSLEKRTDFWELKFTSINSIKAKHVVFATGASTIQSEFWRGLPIHPVKGQLAVLEPESPLNFGHAISARGYIASLHSTQFAVGSTYEHSFETEHTDQQGLDYLLDRFRKVLPDLHDNSKVVHQWAGIRASTPNRMPILGKHPSHQTMSVFAGLGSKGTLYSAYLAECMKDLLLKNIDVAKEVSINRLDFIT